MLISSADRCFRYGDGLFETILFSGSRPVLFEQHLNRLRSGVRRLGFIWDPDDSQVLHKCLAAIQTSGLAPDNPCTGRLLVRLHISRGDGGRGYVPPESAECLEVLSVHPAADPVDSAALVSLQSKLMISTQLADIKHCSRLEQVLAAVELGGIEGSWEGLLDDELGFLCEGTRCNILLDLDGTLHTPLLDRSGLRSSLIAALNDHGHPLHTRITQSRLRLIDAQTVEVLSTSHNHVLKHATEFDRDAWTQHRLAGVAVCNSVGGVVQAESLDGTVLSRSSVLDELAERFRSHVVELSVSETI